jgi:hypothetical protein
MKAALAMAEISSGAAYSRSIKSFARRTLVRSLIVWRLIASTLPATLSVAEGYVPMIQVH